MNANNQLAPCPFCGGKPFLWENLHTKPADYGKWEVHCDSCFCRIIQMGTVERAIETWNRRVLPQSGVVYNLQGRRFHFSIDEADLEKTYQEQYEMVAKMITELKSKEREIEWEA